MTHNAPCWVCSHKLRGPGTYIVGYDGHRHRVHKKCAKCQQCGSNKIVEESPAEGWWCMGCGCSDMDE